MRLDEKSPRGSLRSSTTIVYYCVSRLFLVHTLSYYRSIVLSFYRSIVLSFYRSIVLSFYRPTHLPPPAYPVLLTPDTFPGEPPDAPVALTTVFTGLSTNTSSNI